jgi:hypothetical protein
MSEATDPIRIDFADVRSQEAVKRALTVGLAGNHSVVLIGSSGHGKTMLAQGANAIHSIPIDQVTVDPDDPDRMRRLMQCGSPAPSPISIGANASARPILPKPFNTACSSKPSLKLEVPIMSHIVSIKTKVTDPAALCAACRRLGLAEPVQGTARLFSAQAAGLLIKLPGWQYPVVADVGSGEVKFDNYSGAWGKQEELDKLLQAYAVEKAKAEARRVGHSVSEQALTDGSIKLTIQVTGGAA